MYHCVHIRNYNHSPWLLFPASFSHQLLYEGIFSFCAIWHQVFQNLSKLHIHCHLKSQLKDLLVRSLSGLLNTFFEVSVICTLHLPTTATPNSISHSVWHLILGLVPSAMPDFSPHTSFLSARDLPSTGTRMRVSVSGLGVLFSKSTIWFPWIPRNYQQSGGISGSYDEHEHFWAFQARTIFGCFLALKSKAHMLLVPLHLEFKEGFLISVSASKSFCNFEWGLQQEGPNT